MIEWIMIILFLPYGQPASSLAVPGFQSEGECKSGAQFIDASFNIARATCIPQTKK